MTTYLKKFVQHPDERKRYNIDYEEWLDTDEMVSSVTFEVTPTTGTPLTIDGSDIDDDGKIVSLFVSGGDHEETYEVLVTATTSAGQIKVLCIHFTIRDC